MPSKYIVLQAHDTAGPGVLPGDTVYSCSKADYGLASDDTFMTGVRHVSVTLKEDGDYPFFTIPQSKLKEV